MIRLKNKKAFTLVEMMISLVLSVIVIFFAYTMVVTSHTLYKKMSMGSSDVNDYRFLEDMLKNSIMGADEIIVTATGIECRRYDVNRTNSFGLKNGIYVKDIYGLSASKNFVLSVANSADPSIVVTPSATTGVLSLEIYNALDASYSGSVLITGGTAKKTILNGVRDVYYSINPDSSAVGTLMEIQIGIIYDKILPGGAAVRQNKSFCITPRGKIRT